MRGGRPRFEAQETALAADLIRTYREAGKRLLLLAMTYEGKGWQGTAAYQRRQLAIVGGVLEKLGREAGDKLAEAAGRAYIEGGAAGGLALERGLGLKGFGAMTGAFNGVHEAAVGAVVRNAATPLARLNVVIGRRFEDAFRTAGVSATAAGLAQGSTRREVSADLQARLRAQRVSQFVDRAGRVWPLDRYAEMVGRTTIREAQTYGLVNTMLEAGADLVTVSAHVDTDGPDICNDFEGKTYSLSGGTPGYERLPMLPPFHPRCRHVLTPSPDGPGELAPNTTFVAPGGIGGNAPGGAPPIPAPVPRPRAPKAPRKKPVPGVPPPRAIPPPESAPAPAPKPARKTDAAKPSRATWEEHFAGHGWDRDVGPTVLDDLASLHRLDGGRKADADYASNSHLSIGPGDLGGAEGYYRPSIGIIAVRAKPRAGLPAHLERSFENGRVQTVYHEAGHYIDRRIIGEDTETYASEAWGPLDAADERRVAWAAFMRAANKTPTMRRIAARAADGDKWGKYASKGREMWARAYAQWAAKEKGRPRHRLWKDLGEWTDAEFEELAPLVEAVLRSERLRD